jgi:hypothetical protein
LLERTASQGLDASLCSRGIHPQTVGEELKRAGSPVRLLAMRPRDALPSAALEEKEVSNWSVKKLRK